MIVINLNYLFYLQVKLEWIRICIIRFIICEFKITLILSIISLEKKVGYIICREKLVLAYKKKLAALLMDLLKWVII